MLYMYIPCTVHAKQRQKQFRTLGPRGGCSGKPRLLHRRLNGPNIYFAEAFHGVQSPVTVASAAHIESAMKYRSC